ncbi:MAG: hypothetical protein A4S09_02175 [Proteobacteria bacterium SG_bin7]|nr:MAG: hypothetical protein A4S09_02175 [Proteobacteria bacterium SG_bin7]
MVQKEAFRIREACVVVGIGKSKMQEEIASGRLKIFKIGRATLISRLALEEWLNLCQEESKGKFKGVSNGN